MIYKIAIVLLLISVLLYYIFCFLEVFEVIKFTDKNTKIKIPKMFIPFYYLIVKNDDVEEEKPVETKKKSKTIKVKIPKNLNI